MIMAWQPLRVTVSGIGPLKRALDKLGDEAPKVLGRGLKKEASDVIDAAKPFVPVRTGELKGSAAVGRVRQRRSQGEVVVDAGFGSKKAWYAIIVHERTELRHRAPTGAKFLERPFGRRRKGVAGRLARFLRFQLLKRYATR